MPTTGDTSFREVKRLLRVVRTGERPVVLWLGAGVSAWADYPLWPELAHLFHSEFLRSVRDYEVDSAAHLLGVKKYPEFFQLCRQSDRALYFRLLTENLGHPRTPSPVHRRFCELLWCLHPARVLTTNVDEAVESNIPGLQVLQRSDFARALDLLRTDAPVLCKLHGTISAAEKVVFTKEDYEDLLADSAYLNLLTYVFSVSSVVFVGYGLADQYVLTALLNSEDMMSIVGSGPHFLITSREELATDLPEAIHAICYRTSLYKDHRSSLRIIDMIRHCSSSSRVEASGAMTQLGATESLGPAAESEPPTTHSSYFIADLYPPGTWTSSQTLEITDTHGMAKNILVGQGFNDNEIGRQPSQALHDLAVGLLCFEQTYLPLSAMPRVHDLIGSDYFWRLHDEGALRFVHLPSSPAIIFSASEEPAGGDLAMITKVFPDESRTWSAEDVIEASLRANPSKEKQAEAHFESLKASTVTLTQERSDLPMTAREALLHPRLQSLIGLSDAIAPTSLPRWLAYPSLRLLHVVQAADACGALGIPALKIPFGGERLATAAIGSGHLATSADEVAAYLVIQRGTGDVGKALEEDPRLLDAILRFRATPVGQELRSQVFALLDIPGGSELQAAINGGLRASLPTNVRDRARDRLQDLMVPHGMPARPSSPAIWADIAYADRLIQRWKTRSRQEFFAFCDEHSLGPYDECPCGSGEKRRFCCEEALRD